MNPPWPASEISGADGLFLRMERHDTPCHTLKIVILDTKDRGQPVTLDGIREAAPEYLSVSPRFTQKVIGVGRQLYWSPDLSFQLSNHLSEHHLPAPTSAAFDDYCAELAMRQLDRSRPLWAVTLVHGLAGDKQAVVLRVHHALMDGLASVNLLTALTSDTPGVTPKLGSRPAPVPIARLPLHRRVLEALRASIESIRRSISFGPATAVPKGMVARTPLNRRSGAARLCARRDVSFEDLKRLSIEAGTTLNGALHAVLAKALREELRAQGTTPTGPLVATFGVVEDATSLRCEGNEIATSRVWLHADQADNSTLVTLTARSCEESVALRRHRGFRLHRASVELLEHLAAHVRSAIAHLTPVIPNHSTTANVPGPRMTRWFGDIKIVGLTSYSLAIAPADVSVTAYSYAGRVWLGLTTTPESMPNPAAFLSRVEIALEGLLTSASASEMAVAV